MIEKAMRLELVTSTAIPRFNASMLQRIVRRFGRGEVARNDLCGLICCDGQINPIHLATD
jgi:hypothetical protein